MHQILILTIIREHRFYIGIKELAKEAGISFETTKKAIRILETDSYVNTIRNKQDTIKIVYMNTMEKEEALRMLEKYKEDNKKKKKGNNK